MYIICIHLPGNSSFIYNFIIICERDYHTINPYNVMSLCHVTVSCSLLLKCLVMYGYCPIIIALLCHIYQTCCLWCG